MASEYDATEFVDADFQAHKTLTGTAPAGLSPVGPAPTREEVDLKVTEAQQKLAELRRAQEELERERAVLEETRRRQSEFKTGRNEIIHSITRGLGLLQEAEFGTRRDAEQMAKAIVALRDALAKVEAIHEETWTKTNFEVELTKALTAIENARMEWNSARLKFPVLSGAAPLAAPAANAAAGQPESGLAQKSFFGLCKLGLAINWPLAAVALLALVVFLIVLFRH
jgi:predicted nuclease with TOPRIM domain